MGAAFTAYHVHHSYEQARERVEEFRRNGSSEDRLPSTFGLTVAIATGSAGLFAMATRQDPLTGRDLSWREAVLEGVFGALDLVGTVAVGYSAVRGVGGLGRVGAEAFGAAGGGWRGAGEAARAVSRQARASVARQAASIVEEVATVKPFAETGLGRALEGTRVGRWLEAADEGLASSGRAVAGKIAEGYSRAASRVERLIEGRAGARGVRAFEGEGIQGIRGNAQSSRTSPWGKNPNGETRSVDEAVELARSQGVEIPDDIHFVAVEQKLLPQNATAEYAQLGRKGGNDLVRWEDFYHDRLQKIPVRISKDILNSDEAIVATISHEMHELNGLRTLFQEAGGAIEAGRVHNLITPGIKNNLHDQAWDIADALVQQMRRRARR